MFTLDSDIMGILMALLTFLIPLISALVERKRKKRKGAVADILPDEEPVDNQQYQVREPDPQQERHDELEEMFNLILGKEPQQEEEEKEVEVPVVIVPQELPEEEFEAVEEGDTNKEEPRKGLKERLKDNPKDMVLFSEILNPKFKEY